MSLVAVPSAGTGENRTRVPGTFTGSMTEAGRALVEKRDPVWRPT